MLEFGCEAGENASVHLTCLTPIYLENVIIGKENFFSSVRGKFSGAIITHVGRYEIGE